VKYTVYSAETGRVIRSGFTPYQLIDRVAKAGEALHLGEQLSADEWQFNLETGLPEPFVATEEEIRRQVDKEAEMQRSRLLRSPTTVDGVTINPTAGDLERIATVVAIGEFPTRVRLRSGMTHLPTEAKARALLKAWKRREDAVESAFETVKNENAQGLNRSPEDVKRRINEAVSVALS